MPKHGTTTLSANFAHMPLLQSRTPLATPANDSRCFMIDICKTHRQDQTRNSTSYYPTSATILRSCQVLHRQWHLMKAVSCSHIGHISVSKGREFMVNCPKMHLHRCTETSSVGRMALQSNKADVTFAYIPRTYRMNRRFMEILLYRVNQRLLERKTSF